MSNRPPFRLFSSVGSTKIRHAAATAPAPASGAAPPKPAKIRPAPSANPPTVWAMSSRAAARTSPAARRRSCTNLARLRTRIEARPAATAVFTPECVGHAHSAAPASTGNASAAQIQQRYRVTKWSASFAPCASRA